MLVSAPVFVLAARPAPRAPERRATRRLPHLAGLAAVLILVAATGTASAAVAPSPSAAPTGTGAPRIHTATDDARAVDPVAFPTASDVFLLAAQCAPEAVPLPAGPYAFAVVADAGDVRSTEALAQRTFYVDGSGRISSAADGRSRHAFRCPDGTFFLTIDIGPVAGADTSGDYRVQVAPIADVDACVASGDPTGFGCAEMDLVAAPFRIDPAASLPPVSPSPIASPSPSTDGTASPSGEASPGTDGSPTPAPTAAGGSASPGAIPQPSFAPSDSPSPSGSPAPSASTGGSPGGGGTGGSGTGGSTGGSGGGGSSGGSGGGGRPARTPSPTPYVMPTGYLDCPGQIVTPTGCQPLDWVPSIPGGVAPTPNWSWGPIATGAPIFPGINAPITTPAAGGAAPSGGPVGSGPVQVGVDPGASVPPGSQTFVPGALPGATAGTAGSAAPPATAGAVAGVTSGTSGRPVVPPQPAPTASTTTPASPSLPLVLVALLLALLGASVAAAVGWARRGVGRGIGSRSGTSGPEASSGA